MTQVSTGTGVDTNPEVSWEIAGIARNRSGIAPESEEDFHRISVLFAEAELHLREKSYLYPPMTPMHGAMRAISTGFRAIPLRFREDPGDLLTFPSLRPGRGQLILNLRTSFRSEEVCLQQYW